MKFLFALAFLLFSPLVYGAPPIAPPVMPPNAPPVEGFPLALITADWCPACPAARKAAKESGRSVEIVDYDRDASRRAHLLDGCGFTVTLPMWVRLDAKGDPVEYWSGQALPAQVRTMAKAKPTIEQMPVSKVCECGPACKCGAACKCKPKPSSSSFGPEYDRMMEERILRKSGGDPAYNFDTEETEWIHDFDYWKGDVGGYSLMRPAARGRVVWSQACASCSAW